MSCKNKYEQGFSLIEMMAALAIFSVCILGIFVTQLNTIKNNTTARIRSESMVFATDKAEVLMGLGIDDASLSVNGGNPHTETHGSYIVSWTVGLNSAPYESSRIVDISVSSQNKYGGVVTVSIVKGP